MSIFIGNHYDRPLVVGEIVSTNLDDPSKFWEYEVVGFDGYFVVLKCRYNSCLISLPKIFDFARFPDSSQLTLF